MKDLILSQLISSLIWALGIGIIAFSYRSVKNFQMRRRSLDRMEEKIEEMHFELRQNKRRRR